jgi:hypothetical protein
MQKHIQTQSLKRNTKSTKAKMNADINGDQYIVATPIASGEYFASPIEIHGVANSPSEANAGVTRAELTESIEAACKRKFEQIQDLPVAMRGLLTPGNK